AGVGRASATARHRGITRYRDERGALTRGSLRSQGRRWGKARTPSTCRPCERRGPYAAAGGMGRRENGFASASASLRRPQLDAVASVDLRDGAIRQQGLDRRIDTLSQLVVGAKQPSRDIPVQILVAVERRNQTQR